MHKVQTQEHQPLVYYINRFLTIEEAKDLILTKYHKNRWNGVF